MRLHPRAHYFVWPWAFSLLTLMYISGANSRCAQTLVGLFVLNIGMPPAVVGKRHHNKLLKQQGANVHYDSLVIYAP
jgi:hypothetical protein